MMDHEKLFEEFYYNYQRTTEFSLAMNQELSDYDRYKLIATNFSKWLIVLCGMIMEYEYSSRS